MPQIINTNIMSLNSQRNLNNSQGALQTSLQRLSSGLRINSAKDDAAGLAISERFTSQIRGLNQAVRNANDGISLAQTAEGALGEVGNMMQRIRELAVQSVNDTNSASDRQALNNEVTQLISEVNRIASSTEFNGQKILNGTLNNLSFQVGANQGQTIEMDGVDSRAASLGYSSKEGSSLSTTAVASGITGPLSINGFAIDLTGDATVDDIVESINSKQADTGVQAVRSTSVAVEQAYTATSTAASLDINGVTVAISSAATITEAVTQINNFSDSTGVTARESGASIVLENTDGADIVIANNTLNGGITGTTYAGIELLTDYGDTISATGDGATALGLTDALATATNSQFSATSIATKDGAEAALKTVDFALAQVNTFRSELGAVQNRFQSTIANLSTTAENLSAARSRIQDADFAQETAALTRAQILQQAGVAMLAQANQIPQNVLSLLQ